MNYDQSIWVIASFKLFIAYVLTLLQVRAWFQKELPSSRLNKTPPIGAPKAAASYKIKYMQHVRFTIRKGPTTVILLQIVMVSPGTQLVKNHESLSITNKHS